MWACFVLDSSLCGGKRLLRLDVSVGEAVKIGGFSKLPQRHRDGAAVRALDLRFAVMWRIQMRCRCSCL